MGFESLKSARRSFARVAAYLAVATSAVAASGCGGSSTTLGQAGDGGTGASPSNPLAGSKRHVYVTLYGTNQVITVDEGTSAISNPVSVGKGPAILIRTPKAVPAVKLYTANWLDNSLSSIDLARPAPRTATRIPMTDRPWVIAMSPDGQYVYAGLHTYQGKAQPTIAVVSTATDTIVRTLDTPALPASIVVSPDATTLYVALLDIDTIAGPLGGSMEAIRADTGEVVHAPVKTGATPAWISMSPDGARVYTLNFIGNSITEVDTARWTVTATLGTGGGSWPIIGDAAPGLLAVTNFGTFSTSIVDTATHALTHTFPIDGRPVGVQLDPDGHHGYVTSFGHDSRAAQVDPFSILSGDLSSEIGTGSGQLVGFDAQTGAIVGTPLDVGNGPTSVVVTDD